MNMFQKLSETMDDIQGARSATDTIGQDYNAQAQKVQELEQGRAAQEDLFRQGMGGMTEYQNRWGTGDQSTGSANPITNPALRSPMYNRALWGAGIGGGAGALLGYLLRRRRESGLGAALKGGLAGAGLGGLAGTGYGYYNESLPFVRDQEKATSALKALRGINEQLPPEQRQADVLKSLLDRARSEGYGYNG